MEKIKPQKYMNPITFEAEMFVNNFEYLSKTYHQYDEVMVSSLEKVMKAIETFLDSNPSEILATENTKLVTCDNLNHINRLYHCLNCKTDLGKSVEKVTLHLTEKCGEKAAVVASGSNRQNNEKNSIKYVKERELKKERKEEIRMQELIRKEEKNIEQAIKLSKKACALLTTDFQKFFDDHVRIGAKLKCIPEYDVIESDLMDLIKPLFPKETVKIYKFGSRISGIGSRESDLDLFVDIGDTFNIFKNRPSNESTNKLQIVANALNKQANTWKCIVQISKARVPLIKVMHSGTSIECDINFSNSLGTVNTQFLEFIFNLQPIARMLCIFMKKWLHRTGVNSEMNTYSIIMMVIFYLQTEKILPSMEKLQENVNMETAFTVGPWLCSYATMTLIDLNILLLELNQRNLLKLIRGFFMFYTCFNFETDIVCPYLGKIIKRVDVDKLMPTRYTEYVKSSPEYALQMENKAIVVQDPIQLNHNVTKGFQVLRWLYTI